MEHQSDGCNLITHLREYFIQLMTVEFKHELEATSLVISDHTFDQRAVFKAILTFFINFCIVYLNIRSAYWIHEDFFVLDTKIHLKLLNCLTKIINSNSEITVDRQGLASPKRINLITVSTNISFPFLNAESIMLINMKSFSQQDYVDVQGGNDETWGRVLDFNSGTINKNYINLPFACHIKFTCKINYNSKIINFKDHVLSFSTSIDDVEFYKKYYHRWFKFLMHDLPKITLFASQQCSFKIDNPNVEIIILKTNMVKKDQYS